MESLGHICIHVTEQFICTFCKILGTMIGDYPKDIAAVYGNSSHHPS